MATMSQPTAPSKQRWVVDGPRSVIEASVEQFWGLSTIQGRFERFVGTYTTGPGAARIELTVDAASLDTGNAPRDALIRGEGGLDAEVYPHVRFVSTRVIERGDGSARVEGELQAVGKTVRVAFDATPRAVGDDVELEVSTEVDIRRLGARTPLGAIGPNATVHVKLVFA